MAITEGQAMYCAGLYEGEGTIHTRIRKSVRKSGLSQILIRINMTDKEPLDRFLEYIQVGKVHGPDLYNTHGNKPFWRYDCWRMDEVQYIIDTISPWLSPRRLAQIAEEVSWYWENDIPERRRTSKNGYINGSAKLTPDDVKQIRDRSHENQYKLAREFGVSQSTIGRTIRRQTWK